MTSSKTQLRVDLAHGLPRVPGGSEPLELEPDGAPEAFARARLADVDGAGDVRALRRWPSVAKLGDATSPWRWEPLPDLLFGVLGSSDEGRIEVAAPAEVQDVLRRRAPRTWQLLQQRARLVHRGEAYQLARVGAELHIAHAADGDATARSLESPLLSLAARLVGDGLLAAEGRGEAWERAGDEEVRRLIAELLRARWLHRRLPPGVRWNASEQTYDLRHAETHPRLREDFGSASDGIPRRLFVQCDAISAQLDFECAPGDDLPLCVVRAGLDWLLDPARGGDSLVLTPQGEFPRETR